MIRIPKGCVLWLDLTEDTGNIVYDRSGHGNNGTVYGAVLEKRLPYIGRKFDGVDDYGEVADAPSLHFTECTIIAWFYWIDYVQAASDIVTKGRDATDGSIILRIDPNNILKVTTYQAGVGWFRASTTINKNQWYMVAGIYKPDELLLYLNGTPKDTSSSHGLPYNATDPIFIGRHIVTGAEYWFYGLITHVSIYNRALEQKEIKYLYEEFQKRVFRRIDPLNIRMR
jgi:hypothetical protein